MAYESEWVKLGKSLLEGKRIEEIFLRGKKYKFNYSKEVIGRYPPPNAVMSNHFLSCFFSRAQALNRAIAVIAQPDSTDATTHLS